MGPTSAKLDPEMEDKDGQNPIRTAEIFAAADARDRAETNAISACESPADSLKKPTSRCSHSSVRPSLRPRQTQRGFAWKKTKGIRMRDKLPRTPLHA